MVRAPSPSLHCELLRDQDGPAPRAPAVLAAGPRKAPPAAPAGQASRVCASTPLGSVHAVPWRVCRRVRAAAIRRRAPQPHLGCSAHLGTHRSPLQVCALPAWPARPPATTDGTAASASALAYRWKPLSGRHPGIQTAAHGGGLRPYGAMVPAYPPPPPEVRCPPALTFCWRLASRSSCCYFFACLIQVVGICVSCVVNECEHL